MLKVISTKERTMIFTLLFKNIFNTCTIYDKKGTF